MYRPDLGAFSSIAVVVIRRRLIDILTGTQRDKRRANTSTVGDVAVGEQEDDTLIGMLPDPCGDTADVCEVRAEFRGLLADIAALSPLERRAIMFLVHGVSYAGDKQIDNAAMRAKRKLRAAA